MGSEPDTDAAARELIDRYWNQLLETEPILGTAVGDERFDDRLPDPGPEGRAARERLHAGALEEVGLLDRESLGDDLRISIDILEAIAQRDLASLEHRIDRLWAASHLWGPAGLVGDLASLQRVDTPERVERFVARISATPSFYDASADLLREGVADGVTAPRIVVERAIGQTERILEAGAEDSPLLAQVAADDTAAREAIVEPVERDLLPALGRLPRRPARVPAARDRDDRPVRASERRGDLRLADPVVDDAPPGPAGDPRARPRGPREDPGRAGSLGADPRQSRRGRGDRRPDRVRWERVRLEGGTAGDRRGAGASQLGGRPRLVRPDPERELRGPARRGVPRAGHAVRLLQPAHRGRIASRACTT